MSCGTAMRKSRRKALLLWTLLGLLTAGAAMPANPGPAIIRQRVRAYRTAHEKALVGELIDLTAVRNVASNRADIEKNAQLLVQMLTRRELHPRILNAGDANPAVYGELLTPGAKHTVMFYAHYDGQPADPADWKSDPWKPVLRSGPLGPSVRDIDLATAPDHLDPEWRIFARSASDDKAPIIGMLAALDALRQANVTPTVNLKFLFEGEEEAGSTHLPQILKAHHDALSADAWILADGPVHPSRRMQVCFGARGVTDVELTVYGPVRALHSGHYGNWAPNPAALLTHLLAGLRDADGTIRIAGFEKSVRPLTAAEKKSLADLPAVETGLEEELGLAWAEGDGKSLAELIMRPALNIRGLSAGDVGQKARNAIPTEAKASIDFRLVPDQTPEQVREQFEAQLRHDGYFVMHDEPTLDQRHEHARIVLAKWGSGGYPAERTAMDLPVSRAVVRSLDETLGASVLKLPMLGGSIPIYMFTEAFGKPVIIVPTVNHDNSQHAANENIRLQNLWDSIEAFAGLFTQLGPNWT
jgi:acetylornithine deacetylase/succinyl-diaminopimelate desuccinylase-like protein